MALWRNLGLSVVAAGLTVIAVLYAINFMDDRSRESSARSMMVEACGLIESDDPVGAQRIAAIAAIDDPRWVPWFEAVKPAAAIWDLNALEGDEFAMQESRDLLTDFYASSEFVQGVCLSLTGSSTVP